MSATKVVRFDRDRHVGVVTLADPTGVNPLSEAMLDGLMSAIEQVRDDSSLRSLLIRSEGRAFSAGADLARIKQLLDGSDPGGASAYVGDLISKRGVPVVRAIRELPIAVVCAVNGAAAGGGVGLALAGDMVIAEHSAYFLLPFVPGLALIPDMGATSRLMRALGPARAIGLALTGQKLTARQAEEWGLIWKCVPDDQLASEAVALARQLAALPPEAVKAAKILFASAETSELSGQLGLEADWQSRLAARHDFEEGVNAFLEKRRPVFPSAIPRE